MAKSAKTSSSVSGAASVSDAASVSGAASVSIAASSAVEFRFSSQEIGSQRQEASYLDFVSAGTGTGTAPLATEEIDFSFLEEFSKLSSQE